MLIVKKSDALRELIEHLKLKVEQDSMISDVLKSEFLRASNDSELTVSQIRALIEVNKRYQENRNVFDVIRSKNDTRLFYRAENTQSDDEQIESKQKATENLNKRREFLQRRQEERVYNMMMFGSPNAPSGDASETIAAQMNSVKSQASISFNMISVALTSLGMGYYVSKTAGLSESHALIVGLLACIAFLSLEMVLFIIRSTHTESVATNKSSKIVNYRTTA